MRRRKPQSLSAAKVVLVSEAGRIIGCSAGYARYLVDAGTLPAERGPRGIRLIDREAVERFAARRLTRMTGTGR